MSGRGHQYQPLVERLGEYFVFSPNGCWDWDGPKTENGYGLVHHDWRRLRAHRAMYELLVGPIPAELTIDHLCRNRRCVNPAHMEPVTRAENVKRGFRARGGRLRLVPAEGSP